MEKRRGFTLIEVVVVIMVGGILMSIAVNAFGSIRSRFAVREARSAFASLQARTRAQAIEYAETMRFRGDMDGDSIWIERADGTRIERIYFMNELGADMQSTESTFTLCLNSRGYGDTSCSSFTTPLTVTWENGVDQASLRMLPLGQLIY